MSRFSIRPGTPLLETGILKLYRAVSRVPGGLARTDDEIHLPYVESWMQKCMLRGLWLVAEREGEVVGSIHAFRPDPSLFAHVYSELTIAVHPDYQNQGIGRALLLAFLEDVREKHPEVLRVELVARESNQKAIALCEKVGFVREGRMIKRIRSISGELEDDIPMAWVRV